MVFIPSPVLRSAMIRSRSRIKIIRFSIFTTPVMELSVQFATYLSGGSTCSQLRRWMRVTPETRKAFTILLNSVTADLCRSGVCACFVQPDAQIDEWNDVGSLVEGTENRAMACVGKSSDAGLIDDFQNFGDIDAIIAVCSGSRLSSR